MDITLNIAEALGAVIWPGVALALFLAYRKHVPHLLEVVSARITKVSLPMVSLELAVAKPFTPEFAGPVDIRRNATSVQIQDSYIATFVDQLVVNEPADYAEVDLGCGMEWLTSRLFIIAIVFERVNGIKAFEFVETAGGIRKRHIGWASPDRVRWALARRYPWLERAYADAYSALLANPSVVVSTSVGRLGWSFSPSDPSPAVDLVKEFLEQIQAPPAIIQPDSVNDWMPVGSPIGTSEHATWINGNLIESVLKSDCIRSSISTSELRDMNAERVLRFLSFERQRYIAVTGPEQRFEYLLDRDELVQQLTGRAAPGSLVVK